VAEAARQVLDDQGGEREGQMRGRGRPPGERHLEDFDDIAPPPEHPLDLIHWGQRLLALDLYRALKGRDNRELSQHIRSTVNGMARAMPLDVQWATKRLIESDGDQLRKASGPQEERTDGQPEHGGPVHCSAPRS
jgi:hypothetical protein